MWVSRTGMWGHVYGYELLYPSYICTGQSKPLYTGGPMSGNGVMIRPASLFCTGCKTEKKEQGQSYSIGIIKTTLCHSKFFSPVTHFLMASWVEGSCVNELPDGVVVGSRKHKQAFFWMIQIVDRFVSTRVDGASASVGKIKEGRSTMGATRNTVSLEHTPQHLEWRGAYRYQSPSLLRTNWLKFHRFMCIECRNLYLDESTWRHKHWTHLNSSSHRQKWRRFNDLEQSQVAPENTIARMTVAYQPRCRHFPIPMPTRTSLKRCASIDGVGDERAVLQGNKRKGTANAKYLNFCPQYMYLHPCTIIVPTQIAIVRPKCELSTGVILLVFCPCTSSAVQMAWG